jgi:D-sedoheptulose 7-phosphate isomerase
MIDVVKTALRESQAALEHAMGSEPILQSIADAGRLMVDCLKNGGHIYACGNGGSMCDAMHFAEELSGKFRQERKPLPAMAISDPAHLSCTANDFGYDQVFSRFVAAHGRPGDLLLAISTSGRSKNIEHAIDAARGQDMQVVTLTGRPESPVGHKADVDICTPGFTPYSDRIQEMHIKCIHILIEICEQEIFRHDDQRK